MLRQFVTTLIPLVIIMDPLGGLPFFLLFTADNTAQERHRIAALAVAVAGVILVVFAFTGDRVLRFFGVSLAAFELAGGFIFFVYALQMMQLIPGGIKTTTQEAEEGVASHHVALVPLATPLLAGPGAITAVLAWSRQAMPVAALPPLIAAIVAACLITFVVFVFGTAIRRVLGVGGTRVVERLMGLLLAVLAVQFVVSGLEQIL